IRSRRIRKLTGLERPAKRQQVFVCKPVISTEAVVLVVIDFRSGKSIIVGKARLIWKRNPLQESLAHRLIEPPGGYDVARKRISNETGRGARVATCCHRVVDPDRQFAQITASHTSCRHRGDDGAPQPLALTLKIEEPKRPILAVVHMRDEHRASRRSSELVPFTRFGGSGEEIASIKILVSEKLPKSAVQTIGPGTCGDTDNVAPVPVFGRKIRAGDAKFRNLVGVRTYRCRTAEIIHDAAAIHENQCLIRA